MKNLRVVFAVLTVFSLTLIGCNQEDVEPTTDIVVEKLTEGGDDGSAPSENKPPVGD